MSKFERAENILNARRELCESQIPPRLSEEEHREKSKVFVEQVLEPIYADWKRLKIDEIMDEVGKFFIRYIRIVPTRVFAVASSSHFNFLVSGQRRETVNNITVHRGEEQRMKAIYRLGIKDEIPYLGCGDEDVELRNGLPPIVWEAMPNRVKQEDPGLLAAFRSLSVDSRLVGQADLCKFFNVEPSVQEGDELSMTKPLIRFALGRSGLKIESCYKDKTVLIPQFYLDGVDPESVWKVVGNEVEHLSHALPVAGQEFAKSL